VFILIMMHLATSQCLTPSLYLVDSKLNENEYRIY